jgi:hypothetical protein
MAFLGFTIRKFRNINTNFQEISNDFISVNNVVADDDGPSKIF